MFAPSLLLLHVSSPTTITFYNMTRHKSITFSGISSN